MDYNNDAHFSREYIGFVDFRKVSGAIFLQLRIKIKSKTQNFELINFIWNLIKFINITYMNSFSNSLNYITKSFQDSLNNKSNLKLSLDDLSNLKTLQQ